MQCQKINPNFRVLTCNVEENEKLHKTFRVVLGQFQNYPDPHQNDPD